MADGTGVEDGENDLIPRLEGGLYRYNLESWSMARCNFQTVFAPGLGLLRSDSGRLFSQPCRCMVSGRKGRTTGFSTGGDSA